MIRIPDMQRIKAAARVLTALLGRRELAVWGLVALAELGCLLLVALPFSARAGRLRAKVSTQGIDHVLTSLAGLSESRAELAQYQERLGPMRQKLAAGRHAAAVVSSLFGNLPKQDIRVRSVRPVEPGSDAKSPERRFDVELDGSYAAIGTYLASMREKSVVATVSDFALRDGEGGTQATVRLVCPSDDPVPPREGKT